MANYGDTVPTWDGDAAQFESFVTACRWYEKGLKDSEKSQAASRVWQKLSGAAKAVVKHLNPDEFSGQNYSMCCEVHHYNNFQYRTVLHALKPGMETKGSREYPRDRQRAVAFH